MESILLRTALTLIAEKQIESHTFIVVSTGRKTQTANDFIQAFLFKARKKTITMNKGTMEDKFYLFK
jgi:hypothetical protein